VSKRKGKRKVKNKIWKNGERRKQEEKLSGLGKIKKISRKVSFKEGRKRVEKEKSHRILKKK